MTAATAVEESTETLAAHAFTRDTTDHGMTVLRDEGLYRHLRFKRPGTNAYRFDLVTWPGYLAITGDMGALMFTRLPDMIEFFDTTNGPNLHYWSEKLTTGRDSVRDWSPNAFRARVAREVTAHVDSHDLMDAVAADLRERVEDRVTYFAEDQHEAISAAQRFRWHPEGMDAESAATNVILARVRHGEGSPKHQAAQAAEKAALDATFRFYEPWDWSCWEWNYRFVWLSHAIAWGVRQYLAAGGTIAVPEVTPPQTVPVAGEVL